MERVYRRMKSAGAYNITLGVVMIVFGVTMGVLSIVNGGKLLRSRKEILF